MRMKIELHEKENVIIYNCNKCKILIVDDKVKNKNCPICGSKMYAFNGALENTSIENIKRRTIKYDNNSNVYIYLALF